MDDRVCSVDGCSGQVRARGLCSKHYARLSRTGVAEGERTPARIPEGDYVRCSVEDCPRPTRRPSSSMCNTHYERMRRNGTLELQKRGAPRREDPTYAAMHTRISRARGRASAHACVDCGGRARDWSYNRSGKDEREGPVRWEYKGKVIVSVMRYSLDEEQYDPRCRLCHQKFDAS